MRSKPQITDNPLEPKGLTGKQRSRILRRFPLFFLIALISGFLLLFQFSPFLNRVEFKDGEAKLYVGRSSEIVFYGNTDSCKVSASGSGVKEEPWIFEVPRFIDGNWYSPWKTVYDRYGAGTSNIRSSSAYATITCSDPDAKVWMTGIPSFAPFTQNTAVGVRFLWAGGAFLLALVFLPYAIQAIRYVITGKKPKKFYEE